MRKRMIVAMLLAGVATAWMPSMAWAQEASPTQAEGTPPVDAQPEQAALGDIVVTAQKRETNLQDTPLAITAVGGVDLREREITSIENLAPSLPNVNFGKNVGFARIAIRGVGLDTTVAAQEGRVAVHLDGVYLSRPSVAISSFFDVNRVEVVRGPQGTLYGRNATAGAVNIVSNDPEQELGGYARVTVGNYGLISSEGAITGGLTDTLSARIAYTATRRDGYGDNFTTGEEIDNNKEFALRAKLRFEPSSDFDLTLSADVFRENDNNFVYHYIGPGRPNFVPFGPRLGGRVTDDPRDAFADVDQVNIRTFYGFGGVANVDLGFATLTSVTSYRRSDLEYLSDADGTDAVVAAFRIQERASQFSQELRLGGNTGRLRWLLGAYYFDEDIFGNNAFQPVRALATNTLTQGVDYRGDITTKAYAVFGQLDYTVVDDLTVSVGARYNSEKKGTDSRGIVDFATPFNPAVPLNYTLFQVDDVTQNSFTPRLGLEYRVNDDVLLYATYARGFKSGGYAVTSFVAPLEPEELTDYEGGIKAQWLDGRVRTNISAFYYDYTNLQVQRVLGAVAVPLNAGSAEVKGLELELAAKPVPALDLSANISLLDSKFKNFATADTARPELGEIDLEGNRLQQAPAYTVNLAAAYTIPTSAGEFTARGEATWVDRVFFSFYNRPEVSQGANAKFNAFLNYRRDGSGFTGSVFVRNLTDRRTISSAQVSAGFVGFPIMGAYDPPRTYGLSIGYAF